MRLITEIITFICICLFFITKNLYLILKPIIWNLRLPSWKYIKNQNEHYVFKYGDKILYDTMIHSYFNINPKKKPIYPRYIKIK